MVDLLGFLSSGPDDESAGSPGGSGSTRISGSGTTTSNPFTTADGERIKWERLASTVVGAILGTVGLGLSEVIATLVAIPVGLLEVVGTLVEELYALVTNAPAVLIGASTEPAEAAVADLGVAGFATALVIVVVTAWLVAQAREVAF